MDTSDSDSISIVSCDSGATTENNGEINVEQLYTDDARNLLILTLYNDEDKLETALRKVVLEGQLGSIWIKTLETALRIATRLGQNKSTEVLVDFLVENSVIDFNPEEEDSLLENAVNLRDWVMAKALLTIGERDLENRFGKIIKRRQKQKGNDILAHATLHRYEYSSAQEDVIKALLDRGASCHRPCFEHDGYPLGNAIEAGSQYIVRCLLEKGAGHNLSYEGHDTAQTPKSLAQLRCKEASSLLDLVLSHLLKKRKRLT
jgi:hypothetical protein